MPRIAHSYDDSADGCSPPFPQLLNTTVSSLALAVNDVLSQTYRAIYGGDDGDELILTTAPLAATSEIQALYAGQLIDFESAM